MTIPSCKGTVYTVKHRATEPCYFPGWIHFPVWGCTRMWKLSFSFKLGLRAAILWSNINILEPGTMLFASFSLQQL